MFKNYLVTALRNLLRHKLFSAINIGGLAIGLAATILIMLFVRDEFGWDRWVPEGEKIFRVELLSFPPGRETFHLGVTFGPIEQFLEQDIPQVQHSTKIWLEPRTISRDGSFFTEEVTFADPGFLDVFELDFVEGNRQGAFQDNSSVMINESMADKYFGRTNVVGETLMLDNGNHYRISAVFADIPPNSHMILNMVFPMTNAEFPIGPDGVYPLEDWFNLGTYVYVKLDSPDSSQTVIDQFPAFLDARGPRPSDRFEPSERWNLLLVNVKDIHLDGAPMGRIKAKGSRTGAVMFAAIALLILMIGCFNFINLSTARATLRAREVAVRKVFGASKNQLFIQFLSEVAVIVFLALVISLVIVEMALPWYNTFLQKVLSLNLMNDPTTLAGLAGLLLIVVLGAGSHPAITISSFKPAAILKSGPSKGAGASRFRAILVGIQFSIAIALIISSAVVYTQVQYGMNRDMGYVKDNVLVISQLGDPNVRPQAEEFKQRVLGLRGVTAATLSSAVPADSEVALVGYGNINGEDVDPIIVNMLSIDHDFLDTYGISVLAGRNFDRNRGTDVYRYYGEDYMDSAIIVSEAAMRKFGFGSHDEALGSTIRDENTYTIVGVVEDVHMESARDELKPFIYMIDEEYLQRLSVRVNPDNVSALMSSIDTLWADMFPDVPVHKFFLDEQIEAQYAADKARGLMFALFAGLAVVVASLGLYGLSAFTIEQKTKEIGIRKVMGASSPRIIGHLLWQFSKPVILANIIAWPIAWYFMSDWLLGFTYRIDLTVLPFLLAAMLALFIGWASVAGHAWVVARGNPVKALRYE